MRAIYGDGVEASEAMMPGLALLRIHSDSSEDQPERSREADPAGRRPGRIRRFFGSRLLAWIVAILVSAGAVGFAAVRLDDSSRTVDGLNARLRAAASQIESANEATAAASAKAAGLRGRVAELQRQLEALRAAKVKTVVKTETVTKTVTRWIPNGTGVEVEITGFEGMIQIHDVTLTHAYGYSDLIGIAINKSGQTISYAQLGCTFLDGEGHVLANNIDNKQNWLPGQSWGFDCSGQVDATGGILRVDEMS